METISCPNCHESDPERIIILPDGKHLRCDACGVIFTCADMTPGGFAQCSWCGTVRDLKETLKQQDAIYVTHFICEKCKEKLLKHWQATKG